MTRRPIKILPNGETLGPWPDEGGPGDLPDFVACIGDGGVEGYARASDIIGPPPKSPAHAGARQARFGHLDRTVPLYADDGATVVGVMTLRGNPPDD